MGNAASTMLGDTMTTAQLQQTETNLAASKTAGY